MLDGRNGDIGFVTMACSPVHTQISTQPGISGQAENQFQVALLN